MHAPARPAPRVHPPGENKHPLDLVRGVSLLGGRSRAPVKVCSRYLRYSWPNAEQNSPAVVPAAVDDTEQNANGPVHVDRPAVAVSGLAGAGYLPSFSSRP